MPQSLVRILVHLIFSTKDRAPSLDRAVRPELHAYIGGVLNNIDCPPIRAGGTADHVHLLFAMSKSADIGEIVSRVKSNSSRWIKPRIDAPRFHWQNGYAAFSISPDQTDSLIAYIDNQERHHRRMTFKEELKNLLDRYGVEYDERYLWD